MHTFPSGTQNVRSVPDEKHDGGRCRKRQPDAVSRDV